MGAANFTRGGNGGLNVIVCDYDDAVVDTIDNITSDLESAGYSIVDTNQFNGNDRLDSSKILFNNKLVGYINITAGYYEHANVEVYMVRGMKTEDLMDQFEDDVSEYDYDKGWIFKRNYITTAKKHADKLLSTVQAYTYQYEVAGTFSNGETVYKKKGN